MKTSKAVVLMVALALAGAGAVAVQRTAEVQAATSLLTFGGEIIETQVCHCTGNFWFRVGPPVSAAVIYEPGISILHEYGQVFRTNVNALGTYRPGGVCKYNPPRCPSRDSDGTIYIVGTSK